MNILANTSKEKYLFFLLKYVSILIDEEQYKLIYSFPY